MLIWNPGSNEVKGFATISRLMPWIMVLIRHLSPKGKDPSGVYWELWCRDFGQALIEINDEEEHAFAAGYTSNRALRTWKDHIRLLAEMHFIRFDGVGNREIGNVLLINPLAVARWYHQEKKTPKGWWSSFSRRAAAIKATIPDALSPDAIEEALIPF